MGSLPRTRHNTRPRFEVAQILREHAADYRARRVMTEEQRRAVWAMVHCRTAALGGHLDRCDACDFDRPAYNSCRHRACPKCQWQRQQEWIAKQVDRALPVPYSHLVFTLPAELRPLARANPREVYRILFAAASRTVQRLARDPRHLGAQVGITAVLHTWTQSLHYHPHVHLIVTAGGLSEDRKRWVPNRWGERYLFPVRILSRAFRGAFVRALVRARTRGKLDLTGEDVAEVADDETFADFKRDLYNKDWVVYAKRPFPGVSQLYRYLGRYTHRVGLSNDRLLLVDEGSVTIRTRAGTASFGTQEFLRRFLQHVPPKGFVRVRHFGLFASAHTARLQAAQELLDAERLEAPAESRQEAGEAPAEPCPSCLFGTLAREELAPSPSIEDLWDP